MKNPKELDLHVDKQLELQNFMTNICNSVQEEADCYEMKCHTCILSWSDNGMTPFKLYLEEYFNHDT